MDLSKYQKIFHEEATELLQSLNQALLSLEKNPHKRDELGNDLMRAAHTLKSMAATMEYTSMAGLCHILEDTFELVRTGKAYSEGMPTTVLNIIFSCFDRMEKSLASIHVGTGEIDCSDMLTRLENLEETKGTTNEAKVVTAAVKKIETVKVDTDILDMLMNLTEEALVKKMQLSQIEMSKDFEALPRTIDALSRIISDLQYNVTQARLVPLSMIFNPFPRMIRDLAQKAGKTIALTIEGEETELDRNVAEALSEPLVHLLRNAVDHGIQDMTEGTITIRASRDRGMVSVHVQDSGKGIDLQKVQKSAVSKNILSASKAEELSKMELMDLIFHPQLSTSAIVTETSGRGVGLNVVKKKIEGLGGSVSVSSHPNTGTIFTLSIPLTIAITQALLVKVEDNDYAISLSNIERSVRVPVQFIKSIAGMHTALIGNIDVPLIYLRDAFGLKGLYPRDHKEDTLVVLIKSDEEIIGGLVVDELIFEQDIVVKPLGRLLRNRKEFSGVTILGDGRVALIIDPVALLTHKPLAEVA